MELTAGFVVFACTLSHAPAQRAAEGWCDNLPHCVHRAGMVQEKKELLGENAMMIPWWLKLASSRLLVLLLPVDALSAETRASPLVENMATTAPTQSRQHHLSVAPDGRMILSWVKLRGDKEELLQFATWDSGRWFCSADRNR